MKDHMIESLETLHTKQLLRLLNSVRANHDRLMTRYIELGQTMRLCEDQLHEIRKVLGTREHIPNKQEAKAIRQEKMKLKKNR
jgi:hypothetical protein